MSVRMCFEGSGQGREVEAVDDLSLKVKFNGEGALARDLYSEPCGLGSGSHGNSLGSAKLFSYWSASDRTRFTSSVSR